MGLAVGGNDSHSTQEWSITTSCHLLGQFSEDPVRVWICEIIQYWKLPGPSIRPCCRLLQMCRNNSGFSSDKKTGVDFLSLFTDLIKSWETEETHISNSSPRFLLRNNTNMFCVRCLGKVSCFLPAISSCCAVVSSEHLCPGLTHRKMISRVQNLLKYLCDSRGRGHWCWGNP